MKNIKLFAFLFISFVLMIVASSCDFHEIYWESFCAHEYTNATCMTPQVCKKCGKETDKYANHSWTGSCGVNEQCSVCGIYSGKTISHSWKEATCTAPKTCKKCSSTLGQALGHEYQKPTTVKEASCQSAGTLRYTCKRCSHHYDEEIPATGHINNDKYVCIICGKNTFCGTTIETIRSYEIKVDWTGRKKVHHDIIDLNRYYDIGYLINQGYTKITVQISLDIIRTTGIDNIYDGIFGGYTQYIFFYPTVDCPSGTLDENIMESTYPSLCEFTVQHQSKKESTNYTRSITLDLSRLIENRIYIRYDVGKSGAWKNSNLQVTLIPTK